MTTTRHPRLSGLSESEIQYRNYVGQRLVRIFGQALVGYKFESRKKGHPLITILLSCRPWVYAHHELMKEGLIVQRILTLGCDGTVADSDGLPTIPDPEFGSMAGQYLIGTGAHLLANPEGHTTLPLKTECESDKVWWWYPKWRKESKSKKGRGFKLAKAVLRREFAK